MKRALFYILSLMLTVSAVAAGQRDLQYLPEGRGFVRENGWNRYSRALYGSHANWRLETSDRPLFATYDKGKAWNIQLHIQVGDCLYALDSTSYCYAYYEGGKREYVVSDEAWLGGKLLVKAIAEHEGNNALWQFEAKGFPKRVLGKKKTLKLIALRRPIAKMKMKRNGDLGTDPRENFEALADCPDSLCQRLQWDAAGTTYLRLVDNDHLVLVNSQDGAQFMQEENLFHEQLIGQLSFETPDPLINTLGPTLMAAADGLWDGQTWMHGCIHVCPSHKPSACGMGRRGCMVVSDGVHHLLAGVVVMWEM